MMQIIDIIKNRKSMDIVELFIREQSELYQREIEKTTGFSRNTLIKWLNILTNNGILIFRVRGKEKYYKINNDNPIIKQLKILDVVSKLFNLSKEVDSEIYLFGSAARGEDVKESDIDILLIGNPSRDSLNKFIEKIEKITKRKANPIVMSPIDYSMLNKKDKLFYENIERDKIRLK